MKLTNKLLHNSVSDARYNAAAQSLETCHSDEYQEVHSGSGGSEELPSDLERRHSDERAQLRKNRDELSIMEWIRFYGSLEHEVSGSCGA